MKYQFNKIYSDYANVHQVCREALAVSDPEGIDAVLIGGSLLGMVRDGDFLPWDKDIDFAVFEDGIQNTLRLEEKFRQAGFECRVHHLGIREPEELDKGIELLNKLECLLSRYNISHCLLTGTLLNLYRDGELYPETDTMAILAELSDQDTIIKLTAALGEQGQIYCNYEQEELKSLTWVTKQWRVNIFRYIEQNEKFGWTDLNCEYWFDKPLLPAKMMEVKGREYSIPSDTPAFLTARYGPDWSVRPSLTFSRGRVPGSVQLYKDGVMVDYIFHYIRADKTYWFEPKANVISSKGFVPYEEQNTPVGKLLFPVYPEIFLEEHYGDWCTPVKQWDGAVDNPTIIDSNVAMQAILAD